MLAEHGYLSNHLTSPCNICFSIEKGITFYVIGTYELIFIVVLSLLIYLVISYDLTRLKSTYLKYCLVQVHVEKTSTLVQFS